MLTKSHSDGERHADQEIDCAGWREAEDKLDRIFREDEEVDVQPSVVRVLIKGKLAMYVTAAQ